MSWWNNTYMGSFSFSNLFGDSSHLTDSTLDTVSVRLKGWLEIMIWGLHGCCAITGTEDLCKRLGVRFLALWEKASVNPTLWHRCRLMSHQVCEQDFKVRNSKTLGFHWKTFHFFTCFVLEGIRKTGFVLVCEGSNVYLTQQSSAYR